MHEHPHLPRSEKKCKVTFFHGFSLFKRKKMNSGACGGNDGNGGKDKNGKSPEELHREYIKQMDILRRREEV